MTERRSRRGARPKQRSPYRYVLQLFLAAVMALMLVRNWDDIRDSSWFEIVIGVLAGLAIVVGVAVMVVRSQVRARAAAPPHGWGGLVQVSIESLLSSPKLQEKAPSSTFSKIVLNRGTVVGRLTVGDDLRFQPGPRASMLGAEPFRITYDQLAKIGVKDRFLAFQLRGEPTPVVAKVVQPRGLEAAASRLMK